MNSPSPPPLLRILLVLLAAGALLIQLQAATAQQQDELPITRPGCPDKCGNISIPFPFGMEPGCFLEGFHVTCDHSFDPPRAFLDHGYGGSLSYTITSSYSINETGSVEPGPWRRVGLPVELIDVSVGKNEARAYNPVASMCSTNATGGLVERSSGNTLAFGAQRSAGTTLAFGAKRPGGLLVSLRRNVLVGVGVEVQPSFMIYDPEGTVTTDDVYHSVSCHSTIVGNLQLAANGSSCSGRGCCQASLPETMPRPLTGFLVVISEIQGMITNNSLWATNPCSFAMLVEESWYNFSTPDLYGDTSKKFPKGVPFVMEFAIRNGAKCPVEGQQPPLGYACVSGNSSCANVTNGYACKCLEYYEGNPYIPNGCQDIDECKRPDLYHCSSDGICKNRLLGYDCPCKPGMKGDGKKGTCQALFPLAAKMTVGVIGGLFVIAALIFLILLRKEKKKMREFYEKNGGPILEKATNIKLYKKEELKGILKKNNLIGKGCFGEVYKGILDKKLVAVKKPISGSMPENEQFANEVIIQFQVIHKNIVKLIGCCLEVDRPMLVYEFIARGNLEDILHGKKSVTLSMDVRLSIAAQSAEGLAYMHSKTNTKILHGDVKPANILLDENFMPKISDFGISRLITKGKEHAEEVIGDESYMDPVYKLTGLLTDKSDVYSFGIVILELISRKKGVKDTHSHDNTLVKEFREAHQEGKRELSEVKIAEESNLEQEEKRVRELSKDKITEESNLEQEEKRVTELSEDKIAEESNLEQEEKRVPELFEDKIAEEINLEQEEKGVTELSEDKIAEESQLEQEEKRARELSEDEIAKESNLELEDKMVTELSEDEIAEKRNLEQEEKMVTKLSEDEVAEESNLEQEERRVPELSEDEIAEENNLEQEEKRVTELSKDEIAEEINLEQEEKRVRELSEDKIVEESNLEQEEKRVTELFKDEIAEERDLEQEKRVRELFDDEIALESNLELLHRLQKIALKCLNPDVDRRPSMIEVEQQLHQLSQFHKRR